MGEIRANLHECKHCSGTGTCKNGRDGTSCIACAKKNELGFLERWKNREGLICGTCGGIGQAEPLTERMNKRMAPILGLYLPVCLVAMITSASFLPNSHFAELLAFSSPIIGTIIGSYFSSQNNKNEK
jgi:hypothetical protein